VLNDIIFLSEITIFVGFPTKWSRWYFSEWSWLDLLVAFKVRYPTLFLAFPSWFWHHYCLVGCFIFVVLCRRDATRRDKSIYPFIYAAIHASIYWFYHSLSLYTHAYVYVYIYNMYMYMYMYMYTYTYMYVYVYVYVNVYILYCISILTNKQLSQ
jgi:hypothetical protein